MIFILEFETKLFINISGVLVEHQHLILDDSSVIKLLSCSEGETGLDGVKGKEEVININ